MLLILLVYLGQLSAMVNASQCVQSIKKKSNNKITSKIYACKTDLKNAVSFVWLGSHIFSSYFIHEQFMIHV